jgi:hypothetical protein
MQCPKCRGQNTAARKGLLQWHQSRLLVCESADYRNVQTIRWFPASPQATHRDTAEMSHFAANLLTVRRSRWRLETALDSRTNCGQCHGQMWGPSNGSSGKPSSLDTADVNMKLRRDLQSQAPTSAPLGM